MDKSIFDADPDSRQKKFSWGAAFLGGMAAIGGRAFFGTFINNVFLWYFISQGLLLEQAYDAMGSGINSPAEILTWIANFIVGIYGGYISAKYGNGYPIFQALASGFIGIMWYIVMLLNPQSYAGPIWSVCLSVITPLISSFFGGYAYWKLSLSH